MDDKPIYIITVMAQCALDHYRMFASEIPYPEGFETWSDDKKGNWHFQQDRSRTWGFYHTEAEARNALDNNVTDMWEYSYDYAILEKAHPGVVPFTEKVAFFKYDKDKDSYKEEPCPTCLDNICNIGIG